MSDVTMPQTITLLRKKLPAFGRSLAERQKFQNLPLLVVVCIGADSWDRAKRWQKSPNDVEALVIGNESPNQFHWPVSNCICLIDWEIGPSENRITSLVEALLRCGAEAVTVRPLFINFDEPIWCYDKERPAGERWVQARETLKTYSVSGIQGGRNAA